MTIGLFYYRIVLLITERTKMYIVLRKCEFSTRVEYDTDMKANEGYESKDRALEKINALNILNDEKHISYTIGEVR